MLITFCLLQFQYFRGCSWGTKVELLLAHLRSRTSALHRYWIHIRRQRSKTNAQEPAHISFKLFTALLIQIARLDTQQHSVYYGSTQSRELGSESCECRLLWAHKTLSHSGGKHSLNACNWQRHWACRKKRQSTACNSTRERWVLENRNKHGERESANTWLQAKMFHFLAHQRLRLGKWCKYLVYSDWCSCSPLKQMKYLHIQYIQVKSKQIYTSKKQFWIFYFLCLSIEYMLIMFKKQIAYFVFLK